MVGTAPTGSAPSATAPTNQPVTPKAPVEPDAPVSEGESTSNPSVGTDSNSGGANDPTTTVGRSVDLNIATVEQLNALGAGMIGKRIIEFRPYTSPDEILTRRVLKRADYEAIKHSITIRTTQ